MIPVIFIRQRVPMSLQIETKHHPYHQQQNTNMVTLDLVEFGYRGRFQMPDTGYECVAMH